MATTTPTHHVRTFFAGLFGTLALLLILASIIVVWVNQTLTNNNVFTNTVAPLASKPAIQQFVAHKATQALTKDGNPDISSADLEKTFSEVLAKPEFATIWKNTLQSQQQSLKTQLDSRADTASLNLHPAIAGAVGLLQGTKLANVTSKLPVDDSTGVVTLKTDVLQKIRNGYHILNTATLTVVLVTLLLIGLCVWLSVHHARTARRIVLGTGVIALLVALATRSSNLVVRNPDALQQKATIVIADTILHNLHLASLGLGVICIAFVIGSSLYLRNKR